MKPRPQAAPAHPDPRTIATLAEWIAAAERPLIVTAALPAEACRSSAQLAERCAIPVVAHNPRTVCLPSSHPMHFGFEPGTLLADADLVIVHRIRRAVDSASAASARGLPRRAHRRGAVLSCAIRCAASRATLRSRPARPRRWRRSTRAVEPRLQMAEARIAARRARLTERMRTRRAQLAKDSAAGADDLAGISLALHRRSRRQGRDHHQRISVARRSLRSAKSPARSSRSVPPAGLAGVSAPHSAPSLRRRISSSSRRSAMAPTCSPIRWSATGFRPFTSFRSSPSCSTTAAMARSAAPRCRCSRRASPARTTAARSPISIHRPPFEEMARAQGAHAERVEKPADLPDALARARDAVLSRRSKQALLNVITPY